MDQLYPLQIALYMAMFSAIKNAQSQKLNAEIKNFNGPYPQIKCELYLIQQFHVSINSFLVNFFILAYMKNKKNS